MTRWLNDKLFFFFFKCSVSFVVLLKKHTQNTQSLSH